MLANFGNQGGRKGTQIQATGTTTPMTIVNSRCKVCQSPHRREIDMMLVTGWAQNDVMEHWNMVIGADDDKPYFNAQNISNHARKHLDIKDKAVRRIIEEKARAIGLDIENAKDFILTKESAVQIVVHQALQSMLRNDTTAEPKDLLAAVDMLTKLEAESKEVAVDEMMRDYQAFSAAVLDLLTELAPALNRERDDLTSDLYRRYETKLTEAKPLLQLEQPAQVVEE